MSRVQTDVNMYPVFVKSVKQKGCTGRVVNSFKDLIGAGYTMENFDVYCSEPVNFISEWRCFVRYNQIIDIRPYNGTWGIFPDKKVIEYALKSWTMNKPAGCSMDFGVTDDGRTLLIECNDGFALGEYGMQEHKYAKLISARWFEMVGGVDPFITLKA